MKRKVLACLGCFILVLFWGSNVLAGNFTFKDAGEILLGVGASIGVHELGHQIVGSATGKIEWYDIRWNGPKWKYHGKHNEAVGIAGFVSQGIGSEVFMETTKRDNRFLVGYIGYNIVNSIAYIATTELEVGTKKIDGFYKNDFSNFENKTQRRLAETVVFAHAAWLTYRLFTDHDFKTLLGIKVKDGAPLMTLSRKF